jgi:hypothetical protein
MTRRFVRRSEQYVAMKATWSQCFPWRRSITTGAVLGSTYLQRVRGNRAARCLALLCLRDVRSNVKPPNIYFDYSCAYYSSRNAACGLVISVTPRRFPPPCRPFVKQQADA